MGLIETVKEFGNLSYACVCSENYPSAISSIFSDTFMSKSGLLNGYSLYTVIEKRRATEDRDIFYAILPVFDESLVGKDHIEAWNIFRVMYQKVCIRDSPTRRTAWIDPYWYGISNPQILKTFATQREMKALHKNDKIYINWTIANEKVHIIVDLLEFKKYIKKDEKKDIWYFYSTILNQFERHPICNGHIEETNEWKDYLFIWKHEENNGIEKQNKNKNENSIKIQLISASNLYAADFGGTSDPYVVMFTDKENQNCVKVSSVS